MFFFPSQIVKRVNKRLVKKVKKLKKQCEKNEQCGSATDELKAQIDDLK